MMAAMILMSIAVPTYNGYVTRARVARAVAEIGTISLQLYRWQLSTRTFPATLAEAGLAANDPWGAPYRYTRVQGANRGALRKTAISCRSTPISTSTAWGRTGSPSHLSPQRFRRTT